MDVIAAGLFDATREVLRGSVRAGHAHDIMARAGEGLGDFGAKPFRRTGQQQSASGRAGHGRQIQRRTLAMNDDLRAPADRKCERAHRRGRHRVDQEMGQPRKEVDHDGGLGGRGRDTEHMRSEHGRHHDGEVFDAVLVRLDRALSPERMRATALGLRYPKAPAKCRARPDGRERTAPRTTPS